MKTLTVMHGSTRADEVRYYEIVAEPVSLDVGEVHVLLGGALVAIKNECVYAVFDQQLGPTFFELWGGCTFHFVIRSWPREDTVPT